MPCWWNGVVVRFGLGLNLMHFKGIASFWSSRILALIKLALFQFVPSPLVCFWFLAEIFIFNFGCVFVRILPTISILCAFFEFFVCFFDKLMVTIEFWVEFWPPICCFSSLFVWLFCKHPYRNNKECPFLSIAVYLFSQMFPCFFLSSSCWPFSLHDLSSLMYP